MLSVGDILSSYGPPLFIRYQLVPPAAAPRVTVNAFDVLMREPQLQWPDKVSKGINAKLDLKSDFQTWLEKRQAPAIYYSTVYVIAKEGNKKKSKKKKKKTHACTDFDVTPT